MMKSKSRFACRNPFIKPALAAAATLLGAGSLHAETVTANATARTLSPSTGDQGALSLFNNPGNTQRSWLNFDLSAYSGKALTTDVTMTLQAGIYGNYLTGVQLGTADAAWTASTIKWDNQPNITTVSGVANPSGTFGTGAVTWTIPWYIVEKWATVGYNGIGLTSGSGSTQHFYSLSDGNSANHPTLTLVSTDGNNGTWSGGSGNWTDSANWASTTIAQGIGKSASINGGTAVNITMDANRSVGSLSFSGADHTISGSGKLALNVVSGLPTVTVETGRIATIGTTVVGVDGLTKSGNGTLALSGANTYAGTTTVSEGTLALQNTYANSQFSIATGAVLELNVASGSRDLASATFSGTGTLRKTGAGEAVWGSGTASFNLGAGSLIDVQGGIFVGGSYGNDNWSSSLADLNVESGAIFKSVEANVRVDRITGSGTIGTGYAGAGYQNLTIGVDGSSSQFDGVIQNTDNNSGWAGSLVKSGSGTITLAGSSANTYTGKTTIAAGTLVAAKSAALGTGGWSSTTLTQVSDGATLALQGGISLDEHMHVVGAGVGGLGAIRSISGDNSLTLYNGGGGSGPGLAIDGNTTIGVDADTLTVTGFYHDPAYAGSGITKVGDGTLALSSSSTYTGATTVSAGTLLVNGELGNTSVTVGADGTIGGSGSIAGSLNFDAGANLTVNLADPLAITGAVTFDGFDFTDILGWDYASAANGIYTLLAGSNVDLDSGVAHVGLANALDLGGGRSAYFQEGSLQVVVIPEPRAPLIGGLGLLALLRRRRA